MRKNADGSDLTSDMKDISARNSYVKPEIGSNGEKYSAGVSASDEKNMGGGSHTPETTHKGRLSLNASAAGILGMQSSIGRDNFEPNSDSKLLKTKPKGSSSNPRNRNMTQFGVADGINFGLVGRLNKNTFLNRVGNTVRGPKVQVRM